VGGARPLLHIPESTQGDRRASSALLCTEPTAVALARRVSHRVSVIVINLFLGWSVIGWWSRRQ
jgi:hypothetical protein